MSTARPVFFRPSPRIAEALRDAGMFSGDTREATAWALAIATMHGGSDRSSYRVTARKALALSILSGDDVAAERAALMLTDEGAAMEAILADLRAEAAAKKAAELAADAEHAAIVAARRAAPVVAVAPAVEAPAVPAAKPARARKDFTAANARFVSNLPTESRAKLDAWASVRGTDPVACLCGCGYPSTRCAAPAQTAVA